MSQKDDFTTVLREDVGKDVDIHDSKDPDAVFVTNRSKIELVLSKYEEAVQARIAWVQPLILLITAVPVLLAADFSQGFLFSGRIWRDIYQFIAVAAVAWGIKAMYNLFIKWGKADREYVIQELKVDD